MLSGLFLTTPCTSRRRTVRPGSRKGLYEIFLSINLIRHSPQRWVRVPVDLFVPACPRSSIFPSHSAFLSTFVSHSSVLQRSCFAFLCSCVNERMCGGWRCNSSHVRCLCIDGSGGPGQLATERCTCILAGSHLKGVWSY